jgi:hypothetical protein
MSSFTIYCFHCSKRLSVEFEIGKHIKVEELIKPKGWMKTKDGYVCDKCGKHD